MNLSEAKLALIEAFPGSYINSRDEFIAHPPTNQYFLLGDCETPTDIACKVLEWLSRSAYKAIPYRQEWRNRKLHKFMLDGINAFLHTDFSEDDIAKIYQILGNGVRHDLTAQFVHNCFSVRWLVGEVRE